MDKIESLAEDTGKRETCPKCNASKKVMRFSCEMFPGGFRHYVEPCDCDIQEQTKKNQEKEIIKQTKTKQILNQYLLNSSNLQSIYECGFGKWKYNDDTQGFFSACKDFVLNFENFKNIGMGLLLIGNTGQGKTYLTKAIVNNISKTYTCIYIDYTEFFTRVWESYNNKSNVLEAYKNCDLLVIDDIGVGNWTNSKEEIFKLILDYRIDTKKPIVITSNPSGMNNISDRISSRIEFCCKIIRSESTKDFRRMYQQQKLFDLHNNN